MASDTVGEALTPAPNAVPVVTLPDLECGYLDASITSKLGRPTVVLFFGGVPADGSGTGLLHPLIAMNAQAARQFADRLLAMAAEIERVTGGRRG